MLQNIQKERRNLCNIVKTKEKSYKILELLDIGKKALYNEDTVSLFPSREIREVEHGDHN